MEKRELTFCKWFIACNEHGLACSMKKGVEPNHKTLKGEVLNGMIFGKPAFYFKYGGGLKPSNLKLHYPEDHGFELIPVPKRLKPKADNGFTKLDKAGEAKVREFLEEIKGNGGCYVTDHRRSRPVSYDDSSDEVVKRKTEMSDDENEVDDNQETEFGYDSDNADEGGEDDDIEDADYEGLTTKKVKFEDSKIQEIENASKREAGEEERAKGGDNQIQINLGAASAKKKTVRRKRVSEKTFDDFFSKKSRPKRKCKKVRQVDTEEQCKEAINYLFTEVRDLKSTCVEIKMEQLATNQTLFDLAKATSDIRKQAQEMVASMNRPLQVQVASQPGILNRIIKKTLPEAENI